jgi:hypothetical protein
MKSNARLVALIYLCFIVISQAFELNKRNRNRKGTAFDDDENNYFQLKLKKLQAELDGIGKNINQNTQSNKYSLLHKTTSISSNHGYANSNRNTNNNYGKNYLDNINRKYGVSLSIRSNTGNGSKSRIGSNSGIATSISEKEKNSDNPGFRGIDKNGQMHDIINPPPIVIDFSEPEKPLPGPKSLFARCVNVQVVQKSNNSLGPNFNRKIKPNYNSGILLTADCKRKDGTVRKDSSKYLNDCYYLNDKFQLTIKKESYERSILLHDKCNSCYLENKKLICKCIENIKATRDLDYDIRVENDGSLKILNCIS